MAAHPRRRLPTAMVVVLAVLASLTATAVANHISDVPNSNPFHDEIAQFVGAGCATGFPDGSFHPQDEVKRQQMARFVRNCGGRVQHDQGGVTLTSGSPNANDVAAVDLTTGAQGAGTEGYALIEVDVTLTSNASGDPNCPCGGLINLRQNGGLVDFREWDVPQVDLFTQGVSFSEVVTVQTGEVNDYQVDLALTAGTANITVIADITATYYPFNGAGNAA
jgi:hypothetical protein